MSKKAIMTNDVKKEMRKLLLDPTKKVFVMDGCVRMSSYKKILENRE